MKTLKYKGYVATISFSNEDQVLIAMVEGTPGIADVEAEDMSELKITFEDAVDEFIAYCDKQNQYKMQKPELKEKEKAETPLTPDKKSGRK